MKISRYIKQLENYYKLYGDIEIVERMDCDEYTFYSAMPFPTLYEKKDGVIKNADKQPKIGEVVLMQGFEWDKETSYKMDNLNEPLEFINL